jgi:hypothetical protein
MMRTGPQRVLTTTRTAILTSADVAFRQRMRDALTELRWQVREAGGGAETLASLEKAPAEAVVLDSWLPDLEIREFIREFERLHPGVDLVMADASMAGAMRSRSPRRNEVLHALRRAQAGDDAAWNTAPDLGDEEASSLAVPLRTQIATPPVPVRNRRPLFLRNGCRSSSAPIPPSSRSAAASVWLRPGPRRF